MKRLKFQYIMLAALAFASCSKYTELEPVDAASEKVAFETPANIKLAMLGVYESAAIGAYNGDKASARGYPFGAASIEQAEMRGEDMLNIDQFYAITYSGDVNTTSANNVNHWNNLYALINQTNVMIEGVTGAVKNNVISDAEAKAYEGEARFLRALAHHELLIHFCFPYGDGAGSKAGIPYRVKAVTTMQAVQENLSMGRGTVAEAYTKLLADLDFAETNITNATYPAADGGYSRATKGAAIALKIRIKQHMGDWDGVIAEGAKLGTSLAAPPFKSPVGNYELTADPEVPFTNYKSNSESVFSIANGPNSNGGSNGALAAMFGPADKNGRGLVATSPILYNASFWVVNDLRRSKLQVLQTTAGARYYFNYKFRDYTNRADWAPIIRYAEVLLNVAEAYSRKGNVAQAFALLNAVRNRSVTNLVDRFAVPPADLTLAILNERRIEFTGEGRRWPDIHRLAKDPVYGINGIPAKMLRSQMKLDGTDYNPATPPVFSGTGVPKYDYDNFRYLWPFPSTEVAANPTLKNQQNKGY
ncbi:RagB/SusD family nutrient uptake outer membrane protein [Chitinophaga barathri]|nr:RagB/SusD family nutrient uptake outer membrane protein [Chitinophaga barathri]